MAKYVEDFASKLDWAMPFQRTGKFPLDRSSMFDSYEDAVKYAKGDTSDPDSRGLCGTSYIGQIISVYANDRVDLYKIAADRTLSLIEEASDASAIEARVQTLETTVGGADSGLVKDVADIQEVLGDETEGLVKDVDDLKTVVGDSESGLVEKVNDTYRKSETYSADEIDGMMSGALHFKGSYDTFALLVKDVEDGKITPKAGDTYNIKTAGGTDSRGVAIKAGDNVIYYDNGEDDKGWDCSSGTVDLSSYYTKTEVDDKFVEKVEGSRLVTTEEIAEWNAKSTVEASSDNGKLTVDDEDITVYTLPTAGDDLGGVKNHGEDSTTANKVVVAADGTMSVPSVDPESLSGSAKSAEKVDHTITIGKKTFDGSEDVTVGAADLDLPDNLVTNTDYATEGTGGVVKSSTAQDSVSVGEDGTMTVNNISASKVQGAVSEASKVTNALTIGEVVYDGSEAKTIGADDIPIPEDVVRTDDIATADAVGVVKSSTAQDKVSVGADGTMTVNNISATKVQGTVDDSNKLAGVPATKIIESNGEGDAPATVKQAAKLASSVNMTFTGDVTGSASFDGSETEAVSVTLNMATDESVAGSYYKTTVDNRGIVTGGETTLDASEIEGLGDLATKDTIDNSDFTEEFNTEYTGIKDKAHEHANKELLDAITDNDVAGWDRASENIDLKANAADVYTKSEVYTKTEVDEEIKKSSSVAYRFAGSKKNFQTLLDEIAAGTLKVENGDVFNIEESGGEDTDHHPIKAGDNVAYIAPTTEGEEGRWDLLSGTVDLTGYATIEYANNNYAAKSYEGTVDDNVTAIGEIKEVLGDAEDGLVKDVNALKTTVGDASSGLVKDTAALKTTVGDDNSGLVATVNKLDGDEDTEGSVKNLVKEAIGDVDTEIEDIVKEGGTIDTKIEAHNTSDDAHADLFDKKQNNVIHKVITISPSAFTEIDDEAKLAGMPANYVGTTGIVADLSTSKDYSPAIAPDPSSCGVILASYFYPFAKVEEGKLSVYCNNMPTGDIKLHVDFTEIHATSEVRDGNI